MNSLATVSEPDLSFLELLLEIYYNILLGPNNQNCSLFHAASGSQQLFQLLPQANSKSFKQIRKLSFLIIQQMILSSHGEENLAQLLTLMHNTNSSDDNSSSNSSFDLQQELSLKSAILKSLLSVLRESHRCRALFRKVGGFVYVMSVLVSMEGCLSDQSICDLNCKFAKTSSNAVQWSSIEKKKVWNLLKSVFGTLAAAMRFEPANARFFASEV